MLLGIGRVEAVPLLTTLWRGPGILRNDARLVTYEPGDIIVREGDYGSSLFFIVNRFSFTTSHCLLPTDNSLLSTKKARARRAVSPPPCSR